MGVYAVGDRFKIPSQWLAPGQVVYGKVTKVLPHHVVVVREDNGKEQQFPAVTKGSIVTNSNAYSNVKKGDRVSVKGAKKYDALSPDTVSGEVLFVHPDGKVAVRVGSGQMNVLPQDIVNAYSNGRSKATTYLNQRMQNVGVRVENGSGTGTPDLTHYEIYADRPDMNKVLYRAKSGAPAGTPKFLGVSKKTGKWKTSDSKYDFPPNQEI